MKLFRSSTAAPSPSTLPLSLSLPLAAVILAVASSKALPLTQAFVVRTPVTGARSNTNKPYRIGSSPALFSSRQEDIEDRIVSYKDSWNSKSGSESANNVYLSDIPSDPQQQSQQNGNALLLRLQSVKDRYWKLPPPPEDQFIMTGDIFTLFLYAFSSHSINDAVVRGLLEDPKRTIPEAVHELDPLHDMVQLQPPVWVDLASNPNVPFGNPAVDHALEVSARESLLNHWGPLLSTEGSACVALCTCWLIAGWIHRSFSYDNSTYCASEQALTKTVETWVTAALLLAWCAAGTDALVGNVPVLQSVLCVQCHGSGVVLTQSDVMFIIDSLTVLIAWRWSAHRIMNTFR